MNIKTLDEKLKSYLRYPSCDTFDIFFKELSQLSCHNMEIAQDKYNPLQIYSRFNKEFSKSRLRQIYEPYAASMLYKKC